MMVSRASPLAGLLVTTVAAWYTKVQADGAIKRELEPTQTPNPA